MEPAMLESMVQEINEGVLNENDKLSDHVFQYDSKEHELVRMDKMESRQKEKDNSKNIDDLKGDRGSEKTDNIKVDKVENNKTEKKHSTSLQDRISKKQAEVNKKAADYPIDIIGLDKMFCSKEFLELEEQLYKKKKENKDHAEQKKM